MDSNKTIFILALYAKPEEEFISFEVFAPSTEKAIEFFVDRMNEAFERIYRDPYYYDPAGPLMIFDSGQGRKNKADFEAGKDHYGPLYILDFLRIHQIDWRMYSFSLTQIPEI